MTCAEMISGAATGAAETTGVPSDIEGLRHALITQRDYTLAICADLPEALWEPRNFPFDVTINPPLWEIAHLAWFQELFALRWRMDDVTGSRTPSCLGVADQLFDSGRIAHGTRWDLAYPSKDICLDYMRRVHADVISALEKSGVNDRYGFQLVLVHEDMHAEAILMMLVQIGQPLPKAVASRVPLASHQFSPREIGVAGRLVHMGAMVVPADGNARSFRFDNEKPGQIGRVAPFSIDARVVCAAEFAEFVASSSYRDDRMWSEEGSVWREDVTRKIHPQHSAVKSDDFAAMHVSFHEAQAYCRWKNRRLPTEVEWEHAAASSDEFFASTGHVWEWTASMFAPYAGFQAERYREYSEPWFHSHGVPHYVLKGGSFVTHPRLKYPQYRNFYTPERTDMFCGFRTCAIK